MYHLAVPNLCGGWVGKDLLGRTADIVALVKALGQHLQCEFYVDGGLSCAPGIVVHVIVMLHL